eukprot:s802_g6.t1
MFAAKEVGFTEIRWKHTAENELCTGIQVSVDAHPELRQVELMLPRSKIARCYDPLTATPNSRRQQRWCPERKWPACSIGAGSRNALWATPPLTSSGKRLRPTYKFATVCFCHN